MIKMTLHLPALNIQAVDVKYKYSPTVDQVTCPGATLPPPPTPTMPEEIAPPQPSQPPDWIIAVGVLGMWVVVILILMACSVFTRRKGTEPVDWDYNGNTGTML